jgi:glycosyltransferase involved in cell wall biosynthesis
MDEIKDNPLVSVVLATYNGEMFLAEQLDSILNQTYQNVEIIAVDDCSTDNTVSILNEYSQRHRNMKVFVNKTNIGYIKNFEKGCVLSQGDFISLCDQDDCWLPEKIEKLMDAISNYMMIYCDSFLCNKDLQKTGKKISDVAVCKDFHTCLEQSIFCRIYGHTAIFRKELLNKALPFLDVIPHDWWLSYVAAMNGIKFFPEPLVLYRQHESNLIGVINMKRDKRNIENPKQKKELEIDKIRTRITAFYKKCDEEKRFDKKVLHSLSKSYQSFSLVNNFKRVFLFLKYHKLLLASKRRSLLRQYLFCLKMFMMLK